VRSLREGSRAEAMRSARTCYDHLAGRLGVELFGALIARGWVVGGDGRHRPELAREDRLSAPGRDLAYTLTRPGREGLGQIGVKLPSARREEDLPLRYCVDWTEQRHHLSGAVGRALAERLLELGWISRLPRGRAIKVTDDGRAGMHEALGIAP
jgi:hypothetical protein